MRLINIHSSTSHTSVHSVQQEDDGSLITRCEFIPPIVNYGEFLVQLVLGTDLISTSVNSIRIIRKPVITYYDPLFMIENDFKYFTVKFDQPVIDRGMLSSIQCRFNYIDSDDIEKRLMKGIFYDRTTVLCKWDRKITERGSFCFDISLNNFYDYVTTCDKGMTLSFFFEISQLSPTSKVIFNPRSCST
jgi:hypothetical protein